MVDVLEIVAIGLAVVVDGRLLGRFAGPHVETEGVLGVGSRGDVRWTKLGKILSILRERIKDRPFEDSS